MSNKIILPKFILAKYKNVKNLNITKNIKNYNKNQILFF